MELNDLEVLVLNKIQNASKKYPAKSKYLRQECNISFRHLKQIITNLRNEYPIVSKETNGGGYWIAENATDILNFTHMIEARKQGYEETIDKMLNFIK